MALSWHRYVDDPRRTLILTTKFWHRVQRHFIRRTPRIEKADSYLSHKGNDQRRKARDRFKPKVSVIIPNFNHGRFLEQRLTSVIDQTYENFDITILDDASTDDSRAVIARFLAAYPARISLIANEVNSGSVFAQWQKGFDATDGTLVWICESDDFCEPDFLKNIVPLFADPSVNLAFGRVQFANEDGSPREALDAYREEAEPGIWSHTLIRPAAQWFKGALGVNNVVVNVGGCVWRRWPLPTEAWETAKSYKILGDWYLYSIIAGGGQIGYEPSAVAYFRLHGANTSYTSYVTPTFYREHDRFMRHIARRWGLETETLRLFFDHLAAHYAWFKVADVLGPLTQFVRPENLLPVRRAEPHILFVILGFFVGGGEIFPIHLANELFRRGHMVSFLTLVSNDEDAMVRAMLAPGIPVYRNEEIDERRLQTFLADAGVTTVHSHIVNGELLFFDREIAVPTPSYVVSLHGSYEVLDVDDATLLRIIRHVSLFVHTADKNLKTFAGLPLKEDLFVRLGNAMNFDPRPFPQTRADLKIAATTVVFTLVARGIAEKGWDETLSAFTEIRAQGADIHLLLCGEGPETDRLKRRHANSTGLTFLGTCDRINGLYTISDCALVPSRFAGESFPLCIIQSLQVGTPVIATALGSIPDMIRHPEGLAGCLVTPSDDQETRVRRLVEAMRAMLDADQRSGCATRARALGARFSIEKVADQYLDVYQIAERAHAARQAAKTLSAAPRAIETAVVAPVRKSA